MDAGNKFIRKTMKNKFAGSEIVELGVQIEINGRDFYEEILKIVKNPKSREVFNFLKGEEEKHIKKFRDILKSVSSYEPKEAYPEEYFSYMNSLASEYVFTKKGKGIEIAKTAQDELEAITLGMGFERDSITFYEGMKKAVPESDKKTIDILISEERSHLDKLIDLRESI
jgi:rubrerythrin